jgi:DNA-binding transcriptional LysR family regulator
MDLSLFQAEPPEAMRMLRAGYVEVALVFRYHYTADGPPPGPGDEGARGVLLLDEPVRLITPAAEPGTDGPDGAATVEAFAGHRWIAGCERCRGFLLGACERAGFTPRISFTTDDYLAVQALVAARLGVATLPDLALRSARHPGIAVTEIPGARRHVFAMTYGQPPDPPATARLLDVLQAVTQDGVT